MQQAQDNVLVGIAEPINGQGENLLIDHFLGYASHELEPQEIDKVIKGKWLKASRNMLRAITIRFQQIPKTKMQRF